MHKGKVTAPSLRAMKASGERIVCVTCYDYPSAQMAEAAGIDVLLIGDSLGNVLLGYESTIPVELEDIAYHTRAVKRGTHRAMVLADLPFGSYQVNADQAVESSVYLMKQGAEAVKLEGEEYEAIERISQAGIPVMGHLGFTPQSVHSFGGHKVQGRDDSRAEQILEAAKQIEESGAFALVLELVPAELARRISEALSIPTIGIGAGVHCDGQVQVWHDVLGMSERKLRHANAYMNGRSDMVSALTQLSTEVRSGQFPTEENSF